MCQNEYTRWKWLIIDQYVATYHELKFRINEGLVLSQDQTAGSV